MFWIRQITVGWCGGGLGDAVLFAALSPSTAPGRGATILSGDILLAQIFRRDFTSGQWTQARRINLLSGNRRESAWGWLGRCSILCCPVVIHHPRTGGCSLQVASPANLIAIERSCQMYRSSAELMPACRWDDGMIERSGEVDV